MVLGFGADFGCPAFAGLEPDLFLEEVGFLPTSWASTSCGIPLSMNRFCRLSEMGFTTSCRPLMRYLPSTNWFCSILKR